MRRHDDQRRAERGGAVHARERIGGRRESKHSSTRCEHRRRGARTWLDDATRALADGNVPHERAGDAATRKCRRRAAHRTPAHSARAMSSADGPAPVTAADLLQRGGIDLGFAERRDPPADTTAVQRDSHDRPDRHERRETLGDEIVELLVETGDVREDPSDDHTPTAALNASRRLSSSHGKPGRPK